jgi:hypothetical protein
LIISIIYPAIPALQIESILLLVSKLSFSKDYFIFYNDYKTAYSF